MANPQPFLAELYPEKEVTLADFTRLCMPSGAPDRFRLLWLMASTDWEPSPENAVLAGFLNLRDTVDNLADIGIKILARKAKRTSPYSGATRTKSYRLIPDPDNLRLAYGLLIRNGFVEGPIHTDQATAPS